MRPVADVGRGDDALVSDRTEKRVRLREAWTRHGHEPAGVTVVLAAPHELTAEALAGLLDGLGLEVVGVAGSTTELVACIGEQVPDVLVMHASFEPDRAPLAALGSLGDVEPRPRTVVVADRLELRLTAAAGEHEIDGLVLATCSGAELAAALAQVVAGHAVFPAGWLGATHAELTGPLAALSPRQREVLELVAEGLPNEAIAARLFISLNTVKFHVRVIYGRLGVRNRVEAARVLAGLVPHGAAGVASGA
jgi:DNA-binding NarL/FixJ family response regulator